MRSVSMRSVSMRSVSIRAVGVTAAVAGLGLGLGVPAAGAAAGAAVTRVAVRPGPATAAAWHPVGPAGVDGRVTALTAVSHGGRTYEWAFVTPGNAVVTGYPSVYARTGDGAWAKSAVPGSKAGESFVAATALSPTRVLAFSQLPGTGSRVWLWTAGKWSVMKTFAADIAAASVLGADDVWVFGGAIFDGGTLGVWHYNGHTWARLSGSLEGGSATSATSAWAFGGKAVAHYNGKKWTLTSLAALLPARNGYGGPHLTAVLATSATDVYAIGTGGSEVNGGPGAVVLRYDGHSWRKVASYPALTPEALVSGDGHGGAWFPVYIAASSVLLHSVNGSDKLTATALPGEDEIESLATIPGTTRELAGGFADNTSGNPPAYARIDLYS
jgi:hypothetical protein